MRYVAGDRNSASENVPKLFPVVAVTVSIASAPALAVMLAPPRRLPSMS